MRLTSMIVLALALAGIAREAGAKVPDPPRCVVPPWIRIVGSIGSQGDPQGTVTLEVRDAFNNPQWAEIRLDFSACCDLRVCGAFFGGVWKEAVGGIIDGITTGSGPDVGKSVFVVLGAGAGGASCGSDCSSPGGWLGCVRIFASAGTGFVEIRRPAAVAFDQDGGGVPAANGVSGADVASVLHNVGAAALMGPSGYRARCDLNQDGALSAADVSEMIAQFGRLALAGGVGCGSPFSPVAACP